SHASRGTCPSGVFACAAGKNSTSCASRRRRDRPFRGVGARSRRPTPQRACTAHRLPRRTPEATLTPALSRKREREQARRRTKKRGANAPLSLRPLSVLFGLEPDRLQHAADALVFD